MSYLQYTMGNIERCLIFFGFRDASLSYNIDIIIFSKNQVLINDQNI